MVLLTKSPKKYNHPIMTTQSDQSIEVARLQKEIMDYLGLEHENILFNYKEKENFVRLDLITINPRHEQSFLFHSVKGMNKVEALQKLLDYVLTTRQKENSYTVQWMKMGTDELHTSYFQATNMYDALDKFYYERDVNQYKIFSINLNPVA